MLRNCVLFTSVLVLGFIQASQAQPLASPDVAYVDGLPCNSLCLSYMAWSRGMSWYRDVPERPAPRPPIASVRPETVIPKERSRPAARTRVTNAKQIPPHSNQAPRAKVAGSQPTAAAAAAQPVAPASTDMPPAKVADLPTAGADAVSDKAASSIADPRPNAKTIQEQVTAATAIASQVTAATALPAPDRETSKADGSDHPETAMPAGAHEAAAALPNDADRLVALVMVGPNIKTVSDLTGKTVAIDDAQSASNERVRAAIVAAGAAEVQLTDGPTKAIDQLMSGAVPAAVLALVSPEAAEGFPEIAGFKTFQVPLSPPSLKTGADRP
jgi:hypothetical protein